MKLPTPTRSICGRVRPLVRSGTGEICSPFAARALRPTSSGPSPAPARDSTANLVSRESVLPELSVGTPPEDCVQAETDATTHATGIAQTNGTRMMSPPARADHFHAAPGLVNPTSVSDGLGRPCW